MAKNEKKNQQDNAGTDANELRGGTQGGSVAPVVQPSGTPGGTNSLTPTGGSHPAGRGEAGNDADSPRQLPEDAPNADDRTGND